MATVKDIYIDPSAVTRLYVLQPGSREMAAWRWRMKGPIGLTHHGKAELANAIALAVFRGDMPSEDAADAFQEIEDDFANGDLFYLDLLWRAALDRAFELSKKHSPTIGARSLDVLHVACALELKLSHFLTFDERQAKLAKATGLKLVTI